MARRLTAGPRHPHQRHTPKTQTPCRAARAETTAPPLPRYATDSGFEQRRGEEVD